VPNSLPGRNNCEIEIYGMEGIPEEDVKAHEKQKQGSDGETKLFRFLSTLSYFEY
jgi:hypothetical protein